MRGSFNRGRSKEPVTRINEMIREQEVRVIDAKGENLGVLPTRKALEIAQSAGFDLVEVSSSGAPHVCRIMDYGHYKYEQQKKQKVAKKKQHTISVKEIKIRPRVGSHDYDFKIRHAQEFLQDGDKVKFIVLFRGREGMHREKGYQLLEKIQTELADCSTVDHAPANEGRALIMVLAPSNKAPKTDSDEANEQANEKVNDN